MIEQAEYGPRSSFESLLYGDLGPIILSHLEAPSLNSLVRTSRTLYTGTIVELWSTFEWACPYGRPPPVALFLRTALQIPHLAKHVRTISLLSTNKALISYPGNMAHAPSRHCYWTPSSLSSDIAVQDMVMQVVDRLDVPFAMEWKQALKAGRMDALLAVMLTTTPRLRCLRIDNCFDLDYAIVGRLLGQAVHNAPRNGLTTYSELAEVIYRRKILLTYQRDGRIGLGKQFFHLPNIVRLEVSFRNPLSFAWEGRSPRSTSLRILTLRYIREAHLAKVLTCVPCLQVLDWELFYSTAGEEYGVRARTIDLDAILAALRTIRSTLKRFTMTVALSDPVEDPRPVLSCKGTLRGLEGFSQLKYLRIPLLCLTHFVPGAKVNFRSVPAGLKELVLGNDVWFLDLYFPNNAKRIKCKLLDDLQGWLNDTGGDIEEQRPFVTVAVADTMTPVYVRDGELQVDLPDRCH